MHAPYPASEIAIDLIKPDPNNPRGFKSDEAIRELAENMKIHGQINPIELDEKDTIVTGETRWRAAKLLGWKTVKFSRVKRDKNTLARQLSENMSRSEMNDLDIARAVVELIRQDPTLEDDDLRKLLGVGESKVTSYKHVLNLPKHMIEACETNKIDFHVLESLRKSGEVLRERFFKYALTNKFNGTDIDVIQRYINRTGDDSVIELIGDMPVTLSKAQLEQYLEERTPRHSGIMAKKAQVGQGLIRAANNLMVSLSSTPLERIEPTQLHSVAMSLSNVLSEIEKIQPQLEKLKSNL